MREFVCLHAICKCVCWWVSMSHRQKVPRALMTHLSAFSRVCLDRMLFFLRCLSDIVESGLRQVGHHSTALSKQLANTATQQTLIHTQIHTLLLLSVFHCMLSLSGLDNKITTHRALSWTLLTKSHRLRNTVCMHVVCYYNVVSGYDYAHNCTFSSGLFIRQCMPV